MDRRIFLGSLLALPAFLNSTPALAAPPSLDDIEKYLESLGTAKGHFTQKNPNGSKDQGTLYISRPGRMRFEYAGPDGAIVVAGAGSIAIADPKSNTAAKQYPLSKSPIAFLLAKDIKLEGNSSIIGHSADAKFTYLTAQDPSNRGNGHIQFAFTNNPISLVQWTTTDQTGRKTKVSLGPLEKGLKLPSKLFDIDDAMARAK
jgi:outer membrane lipoprotein-sorting protein